MTSNPFSNEERDNFPDFNGVFKPFKSTPNNNSSKQKAFRWSIDQLAKIKPVEIGTSPASLAHTINILSPLDNPQSQIEVEKFFEQKSIHPSPWLLGKTQSKHVTFSPHPPTTTYFSQDDETAVEKSDASTQTSLSIPMDFDLEKLIGLAFYNGEDNSFNLRRKLFGGPQRDEEGYDDSTEDGDISSCYGNQSAVMHDTQLSSTPLRSTSSPSCSAHKASSGCNPMMSSFVAGSSDEAPPTLSPISKESNSSKNTPTDQLAISPIPEKENVDDNSSFEQVPFKPILKRNYNGSPHWPEEKHYCNYRPELSQLLSDDEPEDIPATLSLGDLQEEDPAAQSSMACTTYFNNMELAEDKEKPVHSLISSWQPPINSTMMELMKPCSSIVVPPSNTTSNSHLLYSIQTGIDSGYVDTKTGPSFESNPDAHITSCDSHMTSSICSQKSRINETSDHLNSSNNTRSTCQGCHVQDQISSLRSTCPVTNLTPPSRYNGSNGCGSDPISRDLIRRKNILKAKLNIASIEKQQ